ncbi:hypothetical protein [Lapidilactobacillus gannanensis]|uniref:Uncharacterized protein n=1 Tax=Lapidilactobacillus gannanensis TaxID=2486002 RepID=A0ABW4BLJ2_9LACO|nr:hypothetical protein [Lapidilactobacillus gannanensis]
MKKTGFLVLGSLIFMLGGISGALLQSSFDVKWSAPKTGAVSQ